MLQAHLVHLQLVLEGHGRPENYGLLLLVLLLSSFFVFVGVGGGHGAAAVLPAQPLIVVVAGVDLLVLLFLLVPALLVFPSHCHEVEVEVEAVVVIILELDCAPLSNLAIPFLFPFSFWLVCVFVFRMEGREEGGKKEEVPVQKLVRESRLIGRRLVLSLFQNVKNGQSAGLGKSRGGN